MTLLCVLNIENLCPKCFSIAHIKDENFIGQFEKIHTDKIICEDRVLDKMLAVSVSNPEVIEAYDELNSTVGYDLHSKKAQEYAGLNFQELILKFKANFNAIPIGIIRDNKTTINPPYTEKIQANDVIVVISEEDLD